MENKIPDVSSLVKKQIITQTLLKLKKTYWSWSWEVYYNSAV